MQVADRYTPTCQCSPESLTDEICMFFWRGSWHPSPALIAVRSQRVRKDRNYGVNKKRREYENKNDTTNLSRKPLHNAAEEMALAVIQQACDDIQACVDMFGHTHKWADGFRCTAQGSRETYLETIRRAAHAMGWILAEGTEWERSMGLSFSECVFANNCSPKAVRFQILGSFTYPRKMIVALRQYCENLSDLEIE